ncbi:MAG TPA: hypothetical protein VHL80_07610, partial [Polyangia bacterium]|nr:hypothetical protein [Polyangia bacterium]
PPAAAPAGAAPASVPAPPDVAAGVPVPIAASRASATKTMFGIPAPELPQGFVSPNAAPPAAAPAPVEAAAPVAAVAESDTGRTDRVTKTGARKVAVPGPEIVPAAAAPAPAPAKEVGRTTHYGFETAPAPKKVPEREDRSDKVDKTKPTRAPAPVAAKPAARQAPIWTYVGVGFTFGLVLLGIYQLVGRLAH